MSLIYRDSCEWLLTKAVRLVAPGYRWGNVDYNDDYTHAEVLALLDHAIGAES